MRWTSYGTIFNLVLQATQLLVLARWLSPTELGLAAIALAVAQLGVLFVDLGVGNALIREPIIKSGVVSGLWLLSLVSGLLIALGVWSLSRSIAAFYHREALVPLLSVVSLSLFMVSLGMTYKALLQRAMRFKTLTVIEAAAGIISAITNLALVWSGVGVISLAFGALARAVVQSTGFAFLGWHLHPFEQPRWRELGSYLRFGAFQLATVILSFFGGQADTLLTGRFLGIASLGMLDVSKNLVMRPMQITAPIVQRVMTPVLGLLQHDKPRLRDAFVQMQTMLVATNLPVFVGMGVAAQPLVLTALGEQWLSVVPLVPILAIMGFARVVASAVGPLVIALGLAQRAFWWNLGYAVTGLSTVALAVNWGTTGVAVGGSLHIIGLAVAQYFGHIRPLTGATIGELVRPMVPYLAAAALAAVPALLIVWLVPLAWLALGLAAIAYAGTYATYLWLTHPEARELWRLIRSQGLLS